MKKAIVALAGAMLLAGCGANVDAGEANLNATTAQRFDAAGDLCQSARRPMGEVHAIDPAARDQARRFQPLGVERDLNCKTY